MVLLPSVIFFFPALIIAEYQVKVWRPDADVFPEDELGDLKDFPRSTFACSGGGTRAYTNCVGAMRGFETLQLQKPKYLTGISGGSWFATVWSYAKKTISDADLLGPYESNVTAMTMDFLNKVDDRSMVYAPTREIWWKILEDLFKAYDDNWRFVWQEALYYVFLEPFGIDRKNAFAWNSDQHVLKGVQYVDVRAKRSFPMIGTTYLTLKSGDDPWFPTSEANRNFVLNEVTPLYVGMANTDRNYTYYIPRVLDGEDGTITTVLFGGMMEPHGYGSSPPVTALPARASSGYVIVDDDSPHPFYLQRAIAHSSFAPGAWLDHFDPHFSDYIVDYMNYWSVNDDGGANGDKVKNNTFLIADGGVLDNLGLGMSLRRRITRIILWENSGSALVDRETWDPRKTEPKANFIAPDISSYFGYNYDTAGQDFSRNQFFNASDFAAVATALQDAQAAGKGAVHTCKLRTIANPHWQIPAGLEITVTFYHSGRVFEWEKLLAPEIYKQAVPQSGNYYDPTNVVKSGKFANFPFFATFTQLALTAPQVNLLSHMTTWVVVQNSDHFWFDQPPSSAVESSESSEIETIVV